MAMGWSYSVIHRNSTSMLGGVISLLAGWETSLVLGTRGHVGPSGVLVLAAKELACSQPLPTRRFSEERVATGTHETARGTAGLRSELCFQGARQDPGRRLMLCRRGFRMQPPPPRDSP